jgi:hypothetical protein
VRKLRFQAGNPQVHDDEKVNRQILLH